MKGKSTFTPLEIRKLKELILQRNKATPSQQKAIRQKMRNLGFFGQDDWGIRDLQIADLDSLIKSGQIGVEADGPVLNIPRPQLAKVAKSTPQIISVAKNNVVNIDKILADFTKRCFDPVINDETSLPCCPGNYIICLKSNSNLPKLRITPVFEKLAGLTVIYTGIASQSLRSRDYRQHFKGNNAGRSTLRKSLGVLFGYKQIPRDKDPRTGKTKFCENDEKHLSKWMQMNLVMYFNSSNDYLEIERRLIERLNPPLNLKGNYNSVNSEFRRLLSNLRRARP